MPRPPAELRKMEEEQRRRDRAHRRLRREGWVRAVVWLAPVLTILAVLLWFLTRFVGIRGTG